MQQRAPAPEQTARPPRARRDGQNQSAKRD
jgi:hypothetical protein